MMKFIRNRELAACFLLLGIIRHELYELVPDALQRFAWNLGGALVFLVFLVAFIQSTRSKLLVLVLGWWIYEELLVVGCSGLRMVWFWAVLPGQAQCDAILKFPLSAVSIALVAGLAVKIYRGESSHDRSRL